MLNTVTFRSSMKRIISYLLVFSMIVSILPLYISSAGDEEYDLPWLWPVPGSYVINGLDYYHSGTEHGLGQAVDIGNNGYYEDTRLDVISATSGEVLYIQKSFNETDNRGSGWGNYVIVKSGNVCIVYAHLKTVSCKYGKISAGDIIGKMGDTGNSNGVHLHIQAYPADQSSSSTDIYAFDKFLYNPLYVPNFRFKLGVSQYSKRYGEHLQQYYTSLSGDYHSFSGGYFGDYGVKELGATVKTVRSDGARVYSYPLSTAAQTESIPYANEIPVYGYYTDAYGKIWYLVSDDSLNKWIPESDVGFYAYTFEAEYENKSAPEGVYGTFTDIYFSGTVRVNNIINKIRAEIRKDGKTVAQYETVVSEPVFEINNVFSEGFGIDELANGEYTYEIFVTETAFFPGADSESKTYSVFSSEFEIDSLASDKVPPLVEDIKISSMTDKEIILSVKATDNTAVQHLVLIFSDGKGFEAKFDASAADNGIFTVTVPIESLNGSGTYSITAKAFDPYLNEDSSSVALIVPERANGEIWKIKVSSSLNLRAGPGTNYATAGKLMNNDLVTVNEVVYNNSDGRYWANVGAGWIALNYATYQSGYLYNVTFNLLCGVSEMSSTLNKAFNTDVTIPETIPTKEGYTFLGWSTDPSSSDVKYRAGDVYSENASAVLYAVWEDKIAPTISGVSLSDKNYVSDRVDIIISASDNSGTVYYSFDGGVSWRRSGSITVTENVVIPSGTLMVKDPYGNIVVYDSDFVISNIDAIPPSIDDTTLNVKVNADKAVFTFGKANDSLSGVDKYTLVYSSESDLSGAATVDITSGFELTLGDGVYYAKLVVSDKVGNTTESYFDRFLIGEAEKLSTPENFIIKNASSTNVDFIWKPVNNADYYILSVSDNPDFIESVTYEVTEASINLTNLQNEKVYYAKLQALTYDGIYLASDYTDSVRFETVSSDNLLYAFNSLSDVTITDKSASVKLPYDASVLDITVVAHEKATVKYFTDEACTIEITAPNAYSFVSSAESVYILITAENGDAAKYVLTLVRSAQSAEVPTVDFSCDGETLYVENVGKEISLNASVNDGGNITVVWYASLDGAEPMPIANGFTCNPRFEAAGKYKVFAVVTNTNNMCENKISTFKTAEVEYTVLRHVSDIEVILNDFTYNGNPPSPDFGIYYGDGAITYKYYSDFECENEISAPINAGVYYVKAFAAQSDAFESAESLPKQFEILRMSNTDVPKYSVVMPSLRQRFGVVTIMSNGVEMSVNGGDYVSAAYGNDYTFNEGDVIFIRYAESQNVNASQSIEIDIIPFEGSDGFYPSDELDASEKDGYFIINDAGLTADMLISKLKKSDGIEIKDENGNLLNGTDALVYSSCTISISDSIGIYKSCTIIVMGDVDRDGKVTDADVYMIMKLSNGMLESDNPLDMQICDIDGDGKITSIDASKVYIKTK